MEAFDRSLIGLALRLMAGPLKFLFAFDPTWKRAYTKVHAFVDKNVAIALDQQRGTVKAVNKSSGSREKYILLHQMAMKTQDPYDLRSQIINVFFPARDTAAIAFGNAVFELARHPQAWEELRAEALSIVSQQLTFELLKSLKCTKAIINETLRLHLPASRVTRTALRDSILPIGGGLDGCSPLFIPKGQTIQLDLYSLHRNPEIWGADVEEFKPQRWGKGRPLWEANWQYAPFLGGMRMCPAQNQVIIQVAYLLVRIAQKFRTVENRDSVWEYEEEIKLTAESRNGVKIAFIPA